MKEKLIKFCAQSIPFAILITALVTLYGWETNQDIYTKWIEWGESMKIFTAVSFVLSAIMLIASSGIAQSKNKFCDIVVSICSNWILLMVGGLASLSIFNFGENLEKTIRAGFPSLFTLIGFLLIGLSGLVVCFNTEKKYKRLELIGSLIYFVGLSGLFGYVFSSPYFYGHFEKISNGMAFHTCLLFILYAAGLKLNCHQAMGEEKHKFNTKIFGF
jgi:hypothetical protein